MDHYAMLKKNIGKFLLNDEEILDICTRMSHHETKDEDDARLEKLQLERSSILESMLHHGLVYYMLSNDIAGESSKELNITDVFHALNRVLLS